MVHHPRDGRPGGSDSGVVPTISADDYTTSLPLPIPDDDLDVNSLGSIQLPLTQSPGKHLLQNELARLIPLRLKILRTVNGLDIPAAYEEILALDKSMTAACRNFATVAAQVKDHREALPTSQFAISFCAHLLHRFVLGLHYSSALKSTASPTYSYSQNVCLSETHNFMSLLEDTVYARALVKGGGMFRDIVTYCIMVLFLALNSELEAKDLSFSASGRRAQLGSLMEGGRRALQYVRDRSVNGDTNIKSFVTLKMMVAQAEARFMDQNQERPVSNAVYEGLRESHVVLKTISAETAQYNHPPRTVARDAGSSLPFWSPAGADFGFFDDDFFDFGTDLVRF